MSLLFTMVREGLPFVAIGAGLALVLYLLRMPAAAGIFAVLTVFVGFFFRNPKRIIPSGAGLIVSPADGKVVTVEKLNDGDPHSPHLVSIFLSIFDVHVNRAPIAGKLSHIEYATGQFRAAMKREASDVNERNTVTVEGEGMTLQFKQIAGLIARRIVFWKKLGDQVERGELVGLIRFGSRTDLILPANVELQVKPGDRVKGGSSVIGTY